MLLVTTISEVRYDLLIHSRLIHSFIHSHNIRLLKTY